jgi:glutamyl-tRNA(Gln) amidotransferase subunit E
MIFTFKPFVKMTDRDYHDLGLKVGLEIHQQLLTGKKLFCRCPAGVYSELHDAEILRHMRPTLSELGEYDGTALMEFKTKKNIIYQINQETVCTYEMDDTPPFEIDQQALDNALIIAMLLNYKMVSEIHISRKQYLDGSIPTGFQRTTIVGVDGWIPYNDRKIGLIQLGLEEDACREVSDIEHLRIYRTDRLGMPLVETVTRPEMRTPREAAEVANILRWIVRSTGRVRTGIGAARQDVNVSINGGTRIEIKGVSRIPLLPLLIYNEARRQNALLFIRDQLRKKGITGETFQAHSANVSNLLMRTSWEPLQQAIQREEEIHAVNLKGFSGILNQPTQTDKVFSKEISDRVRVIACLTRLPNIITSESYEETIDSYTWQKIRKSLDTGSDDALVVVWGNAEDVRTGVNEIITRAREATFGIPSETRQALEDGTNGFERILPGPDRMYPDTDLPPLEIPNKRIQNLAGHVPEPIWIRVEKYRKLGIPQHLLISIASSPRAFLFEDLLEKYKIPALKIAVYLFEYYKAWKRDHLPVDKLTEKNWYLFFRSVEQQPAIWEKGSDIIRNFLSGKGTLENALKKYLPSETETENSEIDLIRQIKDLLKSNLPDFTDNIKKHRYLMGKLMKRNRGKIKGKLVSEKLWSLMNGDRQK